VPEPGPSTAWTIVAIVTGALVLVGVTLAVVRLERS